MFTKIAVALDESPEAERALVVAIRLSKSLGAYLQMVTVMADLPPYTAFAAAADPSILSTLSGDRFAFYERFQADARSLALREGIELSTHLLDGDKVDAIIAFVHEHQIDLLVIGLHHRSLRVSRLWSTVYAVAQDIPCSMLGVH
jgi:nucleotide-binding universal stress UspA family protein